MHIKKKIEDSELYFRQMADLMPAKISNADTNGNVTYFNQKWLDYTGMTFEELRDFGYHKIMHPEEIETFQKRLKIAFETGTVLEMEMRILNKEGVYRWNFNLASPIKDSCGNVTMWIGSTTEIHDQMIEKLSLEAAVTMRNLELEKANQFLASENREKEKTTAELLRVNEQLRAFNQVSNHDLQEPLRKLQMFASMILETENDNLSAKGKALFKRMWAASDRMSQLICDLLAFSENNYYSQKFEQVRISKLVTEAKMEMQDLISDKKAIVDIIESGKFNLIYLQFKQLLVNMIANSLKFSKPEIPPHIVINCQS